MYFVVESVAKNTKGERVGMFRIYVATEERAKVLCDTPDKTWRQISLDEMPEQARNNILANR